MKKLLLTLVAFCAALAAAAQTPDTTAAEGYRFTDVKLIPMKIGRASCRERV